ncbi:MAG: AAA family ATPase [Gammaproteobacteria bacterium]|nr:AAA family ATPase [Gammaproteobacteria bacterium]
MNIAAPSNNHNALRDELLRLERHLNRRILGQESLVRQLLIAVLADGHLLVEGAPGLAKTRAIKELSEAVEGAFHRIQFTPDLLPADLTGTDIFRPQTGGFEFQPGPIFHNLILADEINRAPAKVQSALLEAMAERQITVGRATYPLPALFLVMATQNPIEQEGTYPLPEAQLDRFLLHVKVDYPDAAHELAILRLTREEAKSAPVGDQAFAPLSQGSLLAARQEILGLFMSPELEEYIVQLVVATRQPAHYDANLARWLDYGASPRATIALDRAARAEAWLNERGYVLPDDIQKVAYPVLRHRLLLRYEAEADGVDGDAVIGRLLDLVPVP